MVKSALAEAVNGHSTPFNECSTLEGLVTNYCTLCVARVDAMDYGIVCSWLAPSSAVCA